MCRGCALRSSGLLMFPGEERKAQLLDLHIILNPNRFLHLMDMQEKGRVKGNTR